MSVAQLMLPSVVHVTPDTSVGEVLALMETHEIRHVPVTSNGRLVGLVSDRDLREYRVPLPEALADPVAAERRLAAPVSETMATQLVYADVDEDIAAVVDLMIEYKVGAVPVVEGSALELVGIVSYIDVLRLFRRELEG